MDMKAIRSLAEIMKENSLTRVEIVGGQNHPDGAGSAGCRAVLCIGRIRAGHTGNRPCDGIGRTALRRGAAGRDGD